MVLFSMFYNFVFKLIITIDNFVPPPLALSYHLVSVFTYECHAGRHAGRRGPSDACFISVSSLFFLFRYCILLFFYYFFPQLFFLFAFFSFFIFAFYLYHFFLISFTVARIFLESAHAPGLSDGESVRLNEKWLRRRNKCKNRLGGDECVMYWFVYVFKFVDTASIFRKMLVENVRNRLITTML